MPRHPGHPTVQEQRHATRVMTDLRAESHLARLLPALATEFDVDPEHIRRRHVYRGRASWKWAHLQAAPPTRERQARWVAMHVLTEAGYPASSIGRAMGADHTTVLYALRRLTDEDPAVRAVADRLVDAFARTGVAA